MDGSTGFFWDTALVVIPSVKEVITDKKSEKIEHGHYF